MSYIFAPGATSKSIHVQIVDDTGLPVTGLVAATFPATYYQLAGANAGVAITLADLALITTVWASGGVKEIDAANQKGYYRLDLPNAAIATAGHVKITGEATNKRLIAEAIFVDQRVPDAPPFAAGGLAGHTESAAIKAKTDQFAFGTANRVNAQVYGMESDTLNSTALAASAVTEIHASDADTSGVTTLVSRFSALRAGYLDNLSAGAVALASNLTGDPYAYLTTNMGALGANLTAADDAVMTRLGAPAGSSLAADIATRASASKLLKYVQLMARSDSANATDNATELTEINANGGSGAGSWNPARIVGGAALQTLGSAIFDTVNSTNTVVSVSGVQLAADSVNSTSVAASAVSEIWASVADSPGTTTLLSRLTSTRAGYLDNLSGGSVALASAVASLDKILKADELIDDGGSPWEKVYLESGTANELFRKRLFTVAGVAITSTDDVIGQSLA